MSSALAPFLFFTVAVGLFFTYIQPGYESIQALRILDTRLDDVLGKTKELREKKEALLSRLNAITKNDRERLMTVLTDSIDMVRVVLDIDTIAAKHGVSVRSFKFVRSAESENAVSSGAESLVGIAQISFSAQGGYANLQSFLVDIERNVRLMNVIGFSIGSDSTPEDEVEDGTYESAVVLETYWLKPEPVAIAAPPAEENVDL